MKPDAGIFIVFIVCVAGALMCFIEYATHAYAATTTMNPLKLLN